jgi:hypothetical protein
MQTVCLHATACRVNFYFDKSSDGCNVIRVKVSAREKKRPKSLTMSLRLDADLRSEISDFVRFTGHSVNGWINLAVRDLVQSIRAGGNPGLSRMVKMTLQAMEDCKQTGSETGYILNDQEGSKMARVANLDPLQESRVCSPDMKTEARDE